MPNGDFTGNIHVDDFGVHNAPLMMALKILAAAILVVAIVLAILLLTPLGARPLDAVFSVGDVAPVDFATLSLSSKPNQYLLCPASLCKAKPNASSPVFELPADRLRAKWDAMVAKQPRVQRLNQSADGMQIDYVQRSARFRFPDLVTVRFVPISPTQSTLAIYSRSIYGRSDFGVNKKRVEAWLGMLRNGS